MQDIWNVWKIHSNTLETPGGLRALSGLKVSGIQIQICHTLDTDVRPAYPRHSMYTIYAYIDPQNHPNVGMYGNVWHTWSVCLLKSELS